MTDAEIMVAWRMRIMAADLTPRERDVMLFLVQPIPPTCEMVAAHFKLTTSRIRQIITRARRKIYGENAAIMEIPTDP